MKINQKKVKPYLLLSPVLFFIIGIFLFGLISGIFQSFGYIPQIGLYHFTLEYYTETLLQPGFWESFNFSLRTAFVSSLLSIILGVFLAYTMIFDKKKSVFNSLFQLPFLVPPAVAAILIILLVGQSGYIPRLLFHLGIINETNEFIPLIYDRNGIGIILAYAWKGIAFVALVTHQILKSVHLKYAKVAINLGASQLQTFIYVILPLIFPTICSSFIISFAFSFGSFEIPFLLGPSSPKSLPVVSYLTYLNVDLTQRPYAMVISTMIILTIFCLIGIYLIIKKLIKEYYH